MSTSPFRPSAKLREAARVINGLDPNILTKILKRICQELEVNKAFSADEARKMQETLGINENEVKLALQTLSFIIQQAAFYLLKPALLTENLKSIGFSEESSSIISEVWGLNAKPIVDKLKKESILTSKVEGVESSIHLQLSSYVNGQTKIPKALIHLNIAASDTQPASDLTLEFTQSELQNFYQTLETIQSHVDQIL